MGFVGQLLGLAVRGLRDLACCCRRLGSELSSFSESIGGFLNQFLGALLSLLGFALGGLQLLLDLRPRLLALLLGCGFSLQPFTPNGVVG